MAIAGLVSDNGSAIISFNIDIDDGQGGAFIEV
jgi:hypothetical protein